MTFFRMMMCESFWSILIFLILMNSEQL